MTKVGAPDRRKYALAMLRSGAVNALITTARVRGHRGTYTVRVLDSELYACDCLDGADAPKSVFDCCAHALAVAHITGGTTADTSTEGSRT